jgi:hypothetical protein
MVTFMPQSLYKQHLLGRRLRGDFTAGVDTVE